MRMLKNKNTGVVLAYTELLAERIGVDMVEVDAPEAKKAVAEIAKEAETRKDNKSANPVDTTESPAKKSPAKKSKKG